jgi:hypothetical protein
MENKIQFNCYVIRALYEVKRYPEIICYLLKCKKFRDVVISLLQLNCRKNSTETPLLLRLDSELKEGEKRRDEGLLLDLLVRENVLDPNCCNEFCWIKRLIHLAKPETVQKCMKSLKQLPSPEVYAEELYDYMCFTDHTNATRIQFLLSIGPTQGDWYYMMKHEKAIKEKYGIIFYFAVALGLCNVVEAVLESGVMNMLLYTTGRMHRLDLACALGHLEVIYILMEHGLIPDTPQDCIGYIEKSMDTKRDEVIQLFKKYVRGLDEIYS